MVIYRQNSSGHGVTRVVSGITVKCSRCDRVPPRCHRNILAYICAALPGITPALPGNTAFIVRHYRVLPAKTAEHKWKTALPFCRCGRCGTTASLILFIYLTGIIPACWMDPARCCQRLHRSARARHGHKLPAYKQVYLFTHSMY